MYTAAKRVIGPIIVIATIALFVWYIVEHPTVRQQLANTNAGTVIMLLVLYFGVQAALALALRGSLLIYGKVLGKEESFLLNAYSSLVNFFGPGQSGPGFRGVYLKVKHNVSVKQYIFATLIYYAFYALFSGIVLVAFARPWWETIAVALAISIVCYAIIRLFIAKNGAQKTNPQTLWRAIRIIGAATLLQTLLMGVIYYVELHSLNSSITLGQAFAYSGAANFALFVALTPGAIGIREAFLFSTEKIHGVSQDLIVAANVLDRAVYLVFLAVLFLLVLSLHANKKLSVKKIQQSSK